MNELQPQFSGTSDSSDQSTAQSTDCNIVPHTTNKNDQKAQVLESLLQELSFWEPSTSLVTMENGDGKMRKSRSVNDVGRDNDLIRTRNHLGLTNSTSYSGGTCGSNVQNFHETNQQQRDSIPRRDGEWDSSTSRNHTAHTDSSTHPNDDGTTNTAETPGSPTLTELQARCCWNKAIDPTTGRTYYYDIRTRQTQWEKVN
jgi:WW domain